MLFNIKIDIDLENEQKAKDAGYYKNITLTELAKRIIETHLKSNDGKQWVKVLYISPTE